MSTRRPAPHPEKPRPQCLLPVEAARNRLRCRAAHGQGAQLVAVSHRALARVHANATDSCARAALLARANQSQAGNGTDQAGKPRPPQQPFQRVRPATCSRDAQLSRITRPGDHWLHVGMPVQPEQLRDNQEWRHGQHEQDKASDPQRAHRWCLIGSPTHRTITPAIRLWTTFYRGSIGRSERTGVRQWAGARSEPGSSKSALRGGRCYERKASSTSCWGAAVRNETRSMAPAHRACTRSRTSSRGATMAKACSMSSSMSSLICSH
jgi:hypothetical protein